MERTNQETAGDEEDGNQAGSWMRPSGGEDEELEVTHVRDLSRTTSRVRVSDLSPRVLSHCEGLSFEDEEESEFAHKIDAAGAALGLLRTSDAMCKGQKELVKAERDESTVASFASPAVGLLDTCGSSISSLSSSSSSTHHLTDFSSPSPSSSSSALSLTPPLPPSVELSAVLTDVRLTLDVYRGGSAALPLLWGSVPEQLRGLQYLRLGSEDKPGLDGALDVLPHLTQLRSLAIRGAPYTLAVDTSR